MTCEEFVAILSQGSSSADARLVDHALLCSDCRELYRVDHRLRGESPGMPCVGFPPALRAKLAGHRRVERPLSLALQALATLALGASFIALEGICLPRVDIASGSPPAFWMSLGVLAAWWLGVAWLDLQRGRFGLGIPVWMRWLGASIGLIGFELLARAHAQGLLRVTGVTEGGFPPPHDCLLHGLAIAAIIGVALLAMRRKTIVQGPASAGALIGCVAGLASVLALHAHCHAADPAHLQIVHGLPVLVAIFAGAFAGRRWLAA